jgi:RNA polymerase sigma-70 factor (ECF subfamily)
MVRLVSIPRTGLPAGVGPGLGPDDADPLLVEALRRGDPAAPGEFFDRYGRHVQRVLTNVLGVDPEIPDLLHEVFAKALAGIGKLKDGRRLKAWLTSITVYTARGSIRARSRRRLLGLHGRREVPEIPAPAVSAETREAMRSMYEILERLPADERIAFAMRFVSGMELEDVAAACGVSLATIKRRISRAERRFLVIARRHPVLRSWVDEGSRWGTR